MVNIETIEREILDLESRDTTYATVERLAWLYIVRDHLQPQQADARTGNFGTSEFCQACSNVPVDSLMSIMSEHMDAISVIHPHEYSAIINRISKLKD